MLRTRLAALVTGLVAAGAAADERVSNISENFEPINLAHFSHPIPNQYTEVRNGVLWTRGSTGTAYPPMVFMPIEGKDLSISFRYRHLGDGGWLWFFVDGDDRHGSVDHLLRVKLLRDQIQLQVDAHSFDPEHPLRQKRREADPVSKTYRLNEILPPHRIDLTSDDWRTVTVVFHGEQAVISVDGGAWTETLTRPDFDAGKRKLLWMQNGGDKGIEIDDIRVTASLPAGT